jgi:hypothetical protein
MQAANARAAAANNAQRSDLKVMFSPSSKPDPLSRVYMETRKT